MLTFDSNEIENYFEYSEMTIIEVDKVENA